MTDSASLNRPGGRRSLSAAGNCGPYWPPLRATFYGLGKITQECARRSSCAGYGGRRFRRGR